MVRSNKVDAVHVLTVERYTEGVVFDHQGRGYMSSGEHILRFTLDGDCETFATTGAPNGHKVLADGTHLVCDGSHHAMIRLAVDGDMLDPASTECDGLALRAPNDLTLDTPNGGFYFTDPGGSDDENPIGTVHYVDSTGATRLIDEGLAFPNGLVLSPDGKRLYLAESCTNRILVYDVVGPGKVGERRVFTELPTADPARGQIKNLPDGICVDTSGNLYVAHYGMRAIQVLDPTGQLIERFSAGNLTASNVAFGGPAMNQLFITGGLKEEAGEGGLFRLDLDVCGQTVLPAE